MRKNDQKTNIRLDHWDRFGDCFGEFNSANRLCAKHCVLRLRCAIEQHQNLRIELIEDLVSAEGQLIKIQ